MFTGIIADIGVFQSVLSVEDGFEYTISSQLDLSMLALGDSIAIDGACHSITSKSQNSFSVFSSVETLDKTIVSSYRKDILVNLELPIKMGDFIGGHNVTGHIDCVGTVEKINKDKNGKKITIKIPEDFTKYVVYKGSIAINGISLTVNDIQKNIVELYVIPVTLQKTNIDMLIESSKINIEFDIMAKYIEKLHKSYLK